VKRAFWATDWFAGLVVTLIVVFASGTEFLQGLESGAYDLGVRMSDRAPSDMLAVIAIDERTIASLGRWPLPRDQHARVLDILRGGQAKVVGLTVPLSEPQVDPGLAYINELEAFYGQSQMARKAPEELRHLHGELSQAAKRNHGRRSGGGSDTIVEIYDVYAQSSLAGPLGKEIATLGEKLAAASTVLDSDRILSASIAASRNTVLPVALELGEPQGKPDRNLPDYTSRSALLNVDDRIGAVEHRMLPRRTVKAALPIAALGGSSMGIGHLSFPPDADGAVRTVPLVLLYYDTYIPSMALQLVAGSLNLRPDDIQVHLGEGVQIGELIIPTDGQLQVRTFFYGDQGGSPPFSVDSFYDVLTGKIPPEKYRDKIVLIGATAMVVSPPLVTPISPSMPPVLALAHSVSSILNEDSFIVPGWAPLAKYGVLAAIGLYLMFVFSRLRVGLAAGITTGLLLALLATHLVLMTTQALWLPLMVPAVLLVTGHLALTAKHFLAREKTELKSDTGSAESNRMLGLAFQGQGQLDTAFEAFLKCPLDDSLMDPLYTLGLDFERKRQFNKATTVYKHMARHDNSYGDIQQRMGRIKALEQTVMLGGAGAGTAPGTLMMNGGGVQLPMLGRYQVEKELGKGAMGVVYLCRDPKMNRVVALKTMALSQEFDEDELQDVKERFFREAETAGRLTHPNIVTIYDAGEEHDLAYIAMEYLQGEDLAPYTEPESLLPIATVLDLVASAADALDYAHAQNVVHRDIKPANLMYRPVTGTLKITDFGIARITDSSKTKTGMVLGTPSYMSPEQLTGAKVDGRSDLFSLGVMLFQLLTGSLPFQGDSMGSLMFKIASEDHEDVLELRPELPADLKPIIDKALQKYPDQRYKRGRQMARDLRACAARLEGGAGTAP